jgi:hypothetical protein
VEIEAGAITCDILVYNLEASLSLSLSLSLYIYIYICMLYN